jgi:tripartite ATP-independent transporter DctM subunit
MPVIIIVGIRGGVFTPTEAGAFAVVYALIVCAFVYKELSWEKLKKSFLATVSSVATITFLVAAANVVAYYLTLAQLPTKIAAYLSGIIGNRFLIIIAVNVFLLIMGMVMDTIPNILIFAPLLIPIMKAAGFNEYHAAFIMAYNLVIGCITPPVGTVLYVSQKVGGISFGTLVKKLTPFLLIHIAALLFFSLIPELYTVPLGWLT